MKKIKCPRSVMAILVLMLTVSFSNCSIQTGTSRSSRSTFKAKKLPPGQAKKIYGGKSAKRYAPGHNK